MAQIFRNIRGGSLSNGGNLGPGGKPVPGSWSDPNHPIMQDIACLYPLNEGMAGFHDTGGSSEAWPRYADEQGIYYGERMQLELTTTSFWQTHDTNLIGDVAVKGDANGVIQLRNGVTGDHIPRWDFSKGLTIWFKFGRITSVPTNLGMITIGTATANQRVATIFFTPGSTMFFRVTNDGSTVTSASNNPTSTTFNSFFGVVYRDEIQLWGSSDVSGSNGTGNIYQLATTAFTGPLFQPTVDYTLVFGRNSDWSAAATTFDAEMLGAGIWLRPLGQEEMLQLHNDPWCMFPGGYVVDGQSGGGGPGGPFPGDPPDPDPFPGPNPGTPYTERPFLYYAHDFEFLKDPLDTTRIDSYEIDFAWTRWKFIRRIWIAAVTTSTVTMEVFVDEVSSFTTTFSSAPAAGWGMTEIKFPAGLKGRMFRFIFTASTSFKLFLDQSDIEWHPLNGERGYQRFPLQVSRIHER